MANPLILSTQRSERMVQLGREKRRQDRKEEADTIITEAIKILGHHLPQMLEEPPRATQFEALWPKVDAQLREVLKTRSAYLSAYAFLCKKLEQGNREGIWHIATPPPYLTLRRNYPFRTESWHKATINMANALNHWRRRLSEPTADTDQLFARLLLCSLTYGGLCRSDLWVPFGQALQALAPLHGNAELTWLTLRLEPGVYPSNSYYRVDKIDNTDDATYESESNVDTSVKKAVTEVHYMLDPISLGVLHQFLKSRRHDWCPPKTVQACHALLEAEIGTNHSLRELCRGTIGFTEHLPGIALPQILLEYAIGRTSSASLPEQYWHRLLTPMLFPASLDSYSIFNVPQTSAQTGRLQAPKSKSPYLLEELRTIFRKDPAAPKGTSKVISELKSLLQKNEATLSEYVLVGWLLCIVEERRLRVSTASRYLESIGKTWLAMTVQLPLANYDSTDFSDLYYSILNQPWTPTTREYMAGRLQDLHTFAMRNFSFPHLNESLTVSDNETPHVSAAIVDEPLFAGLLAQIDCFKDADYAQRAMIRCVLILAYRTGLRPGEIAKLRLKDMEPSTVGWLFIRNNRHGHNKTDSALRKVPLYPMLTPSESELVKRYLGERRMTAETDAELIFHAQGNPHELFNMQQLSQIVKTVLNQLSGGLSYRLYHLRHSCLSRFQLLLHSDLVPLPKFVQQAMLPYSEHQQAEILQIVTGKQRIRDRYIALAVMAGHSSPEITLNNYLHFTDLLLGLHLNNNHMPLSKQESCFLFGLSTSKYRQLGDAQTSSTTLTPHKLRPFLSRHLREYYAKETNKQRHGIQAKMLADAHRASHLEQSEAALKLIEKGGEISNIASKFSLSEQQIHDWHKAAIALSHLKTTKGLPRLFPHSRQNKLLPAELGTTVEKHAFRDALKVCQVMRHRRKSMREFRWVIQYCLTHLNSSHKGIKFTDPKTFRRAMAMVSHILPKSQWHLDLHVPTDKPSRRWYTHTALHVTRHPLRKINQFPKGYGELTLLQPPSKESSKANSSPLLRYLLHRFAIILFKAHQITCWTLDSEDDILQQVIESRDRMLNQRNDPL